MDRVATRLKCIELARPLFPTSADRDAMMRVAQELFDWATEAAQPAGDSGASGSPSGSSDVKYAPGSTVVVPEGTMASFREASFRDDHYVIRAGKWDPDEIKRMSES